MRLPAASSLDGFEQAVAALAAHTPHFAMPRLEVRTLGRFIALRPATELGALHPLQRLADASVRDLDHWRATPDPAELQRRLADPGLSSTQRDRVKQWGYPYVFADWRFHMTLSDSFADDHEAAARREKLLQEARQHFAAALAQPLDCESLCIYSQPVEGAASVLSRRFELAS